MSQLRYVLLYLMMAAALLFALAGLFAGCAPDHGIAVLESPALRTSAIGGTLGRVCQRHDAYVLADGTLDPGTRQTYLNDTIYLRGVLIQPSVTAAVLQAPLGRVCDRHDVYVLNDPRWTALQLRANLRDTALLRTAISALPPQPLASPASP